MIYIFLIFILFFGCGWVLNRKRLERMFSKKKFINYTKENIDVLKSNIIALPPDMRSKVYNASTAFALISYIVIYMISLYFIQDVMFAPFVLIAVLCDFCESNYVTHYLQHGETTDLQDTLVHAASIYRSLFFLYIAIELLITIF